MTTQAQGEFHGAAPERAASNWQQLIESASRGIAEAETQLDRELRPCVTGFLRARFSPGTLRRAGGIDELTQLTLIQFFRVLARGWQCASRAAMLAYVRKIACNCTRAGVRYYVGAQKRSREREEPFDLRRHDRAAPPSNPADALALEEKERLIAAALSPAHAELFAAIVLGEPLYVFAACHDVDLRTVRRWLIGLRHYVTARMATFARPVCYGRCAGVREVSYYVSIN